MIAYDGEEFHFSEKVEDPSLVSMRNVAGEIKGSECAVIFTEEKTCVQLLYGADTAHDVGKLS